MDVNVVDLIKNDHREFERLFEALRNQPDQRPTLAPQMLTLLTAHSRAEEQQVYPAAVAAGISEDVEHSQKEHLAADQLAADLAGTEPGAAAFEAKLDKLIEAVTHHLEEEEESVLPAMQEQMSAEELSELGQAFLESRQKHLGDFPADITKDALEQQAINADVPGGSAMTKSELRSKLGEAAEE